jgi:NADPH:quinone reductase-like Zn-dependent oxidoreductase
LRVRISAAGLNPVDWKLAGSAEAARQFGLTLPTGFGNDFAGVVDEVGAASMTSRRAPWQSPGAPPTPQ